MHNAFNVVVNNMLIAITAIIENIQYTEARQTVYFIHKFGLLDKAITKP